MIADHMFEPVTSYSLPGHLFMVSNWSGSCPLVDPITTAVVSGTPTACLNQPSTPPSIFNQPGYAPTGQTYPNYAWTDMTYLMNNHQVNALGTPVANGTPAPVSWAYYRADATTPDCPNFGPTCTPGTPQTAAGTIEYWNPLPFFTTVHFDGTTAPGQPTPLPNTLGQMGNIQPHANFYTAALSGTLPAVSWIVPQISKSDHQPYSVDAGQSFVTRVLTLPRAWGSGAVAAHGGVPAVG